MRRRIETVHGHQIPSPRLTAQGLKLALWYLALPTLGLLLLFDILVWIIGLLAFDRCVAVWCFFY
ncbi:MAG: hypothetical protein MRY63_04915 [Neomegalonema sp.]|nr:hypothetical protein [Neomegalonema sp.]